MVGRIQRDRQERLQRRSGCGQRRQVIVSIDVVSSKIALIKTMEAGQEIGRQQVAWSEQTIGKGQEASW